jgi:hypothetical protein
MLSRPSTLPAGFIQPCLPTKAQRPPSGTLWLHEIKHDGFRVIARKDGPRVKLYSRPGNDLTKRFPLIVKALARLRARRPATSTARRVLRRQGPSIIYFGVVPATSLSGLADMVRSCGIVESAGLPPDT